MKTTDLKKDDAVRITSEFVWSQTGSGEIHTRSKSKEAFVVLRVNEKSVTLRPITFDHDGATISMQRSVFGQKQKEWDVRKHTPGHTTVRLSHSRNADTVLEKHDTAYAAHKSVARTEKLTAEYLKEIAADRTHLTEKQVADIRAFAAAPPLGTVEDEFWPHPEAFAKEVAACCRILGVGYNLKEDEAEFLVEPLIHASVVFGEITGKDLLATRSRLVTLESRSGIPPLELVHRGRKRRAPKKVPKQFPLALDREPTDRLAASFTHRLIQLIGEGFSVGLVPEGYGFRLTITHLARRREATVVLPVDHLTEEKLLKYEAVLVADIESATEPNIKKPVFTSTVAHA